MKRRSGRRPGSSGTRDAILRAAQTLFADQGFDRTSLRAIGAAAAVDPALVLHYFGSKQRLFLSAVELPIDPQQVIAYVLDGERAEAGRRLAEMFVDVLGEERARARVTAMVRAAASEPAAAELMREILSQRVFGPLAAALGVEDAPLRANLVGSQIVGLVMARHVVRVEPLASLPPERLAAAIAPNLQRYLFDPLD